MALPQWLRRQSVEIPRDEALGVRRRPRSPRVVYPLIGGVLGLGAPLGAFALRWLSDPGVRMDPPVELARYSFFYAYLLFGTCLAFVVAGFAAGDRAARLRQAESFYHRLADHDPLTGLLNTRAFQERYRRSIARSSKLGTPLSLLLLDVDKLKEINDRHGHTAGDDALMHVGDVLRRTKRAEDAAARWGGDEFAILLDGADQEAATRVASAVLERLQSAPMRFAPDEKPVSVTIGLATGNPTRGKDLFEAADHALYEGKQLGRNQFRSIVLPVE